MEICDIGRLTVFRESSKPTILYIWSEISRNLTGIHFGYAADMV